jgi:Domain of unknown function (DUF4279)
MGPVDNKLEEINLKAIEEIELKTWGVTQQFTDIHQIIYDNNKPRIAKVDRDTNNGTATVYFPVDGERFYFAVCLTIDPKVTVVGIYVEPYISVCFSASSETIDLDKLADMTILKSTSTWKKGDLKRIEGTVQHQINRIRIEPNPVPDEFEDKIKLLLDLLETDKSGVTELVEKAAGYVQVAMEFHNGNTMLGGFNISKEIITRMAALNLEIDFDLYVGGKFYK